MGERMNVEQSGKNMRARKKSYINRIARSHARTSESNKAFPRAVIV